VLSSLPSTSVWEAHTPLDLRVGYAMNNDDTSEIQQIQSAISDTASRNHTPLIGQQRAASGLEAEEVVCPFHEISFSAAPAATSSDSRPLDGQSKLQPFRSI
jgi:hypothetical protein